MCYCISPKIGDEAGLTRDRHKYGAVAQLGERYVRNVEVVGSIPICSTKIEMPPPVLGGGKAMC